MKKTNSLQIRLGVGLAVVATSTLALALRPSTTTREYQPLLDASSEVAVLTNLSSSFRNLAQRVEPGVVHISVKVDAPQAALHSFENEPGMELMPGVPEDLLRRFFRGPGGGSPRLRKPDDGRNYHEFDVPPASKVGSGWIYDDEGHIITNNHVVQDAREITVKLIDDREFKARVVGTDPATDIAVLEIDARDLTPIELTQDATEQGDIVFAFGSPLQFEFSMSQGVISGKGREMGLLGATGYENYIQTDAAINPGNSGGPLTNIYGDVIGMNSAIASRSGFFSGMGFAIPAAMILPVVEQLIDRGTVTRGYLGVTIQDDENLLRSFGFEGRGVLVSNVLPDLPGARAGLRRGDIITSIDGKPVETSQELRQTIASKRPNTKVELELVRNSERERVDVVLAELPADQILTADSAPRLDGRGAQERPGSEDLRELGIERAATLTPELAERLRIEGITGAVVQEVRPTSVAAQAGIRPGTIIVEVMDDPVEGLSTLVELVARQDLHRGVRLTVHDKGMDHYVLLKLPS